MAKSRVEIKTKDIDRGWKEIVAQVGNINGAYVQVGLQAGDKADKRIKKKGQSDKIVKTDVDIALIAAYNEFGTDHIPSRPFMRQTFEKNSEELTKRIRAEWAAVLAGRKKAQESLAQLGMWYQAKTDYELVNGGFAPNAPQTEKRKKSTRPLIDTARLRQSIRYVIKGGSGK